MGEFWEVQLIESELVNTTLLYPCFDIAAYSDFSGDQQTDCNWDGYTDSTNLQSFPFSLFIILELLYIRTMYYNITFFKLKYVWNQ